MTRLAVDFFDGRSARAVEATLEVDSDALVIRDAASDAELRRADLRGLRWPERTVAPTRILTLGMGEVHARGAADWDAWVAAEVGVRDSAIVRLQHGWHWALTALVLLIAGAAAGYRWGIPWVAGQVVDALPMTVDARIGDVALPQVEKLMLKPSALSVAEQDAWREKFAAMLRRADIDAESVTLLFRGSRIGPNAFALPGGSIVITDELIDLAEREQALTEPMVLGVLAHEVGHVLRRHGMRHLVSTSLLGAATSALWGDYSSALALAPTMLGQAGYSRAAEREADETSVQVLQRAGITTAGMVRFFTVLDDYLRDEAWRECMEAEIGDEEDTEDAEAAAEAACAEAEDTPRDAQLGIAFASHPSDEERIARFARAAGRGSAASRAQ
ncbi:MAG: M48 family metallopeptidase [Gammaproteobacteria bacterium]